MSLEGHAAVKFVTGRRLASSSGGGWTNMLAERWSHAVGELPSILPRDTEIAVLLSGGTLVERQGPGLPQRTFACPFRKFYPAWIRVVRQNRRITIGGTVQGLLRRATYCLHSTRGTMAPFKPKPRQPPMTKAELRAQGIKALAQATTPIIKLPMKIRRQCGRCGDFNSVLVEPGQVVPAFECSACGYPAE
jgi:hypothetical protein